MAEAKGDGRPTGRAYPGRRRRTCAVIGVVCGAALIGCDTYVSRQYEIAPRPPESNASEFDHALVVLFVDGVAERFGMEVERRERAGEGISWWRRGSLSLFVCNDTDGYLLVSVSEISPRLSPLGDSVRTAVMDTLQSRLGARVRESRALPDADSTVRFCVL